MDLIKYISALLVLSLFVCANAFGNERDATFNRLCFFYKNPTLENFEKIQIDLSNSVKHYPDDQQKILFGVFLNSVHEKYHWPIRDIGFGPIAKRIRTDKTGFKEFVADDYEVNALKLDIWWFQFFATGEIEYAQKVLKYAGNKDEMNIDEMIISGAATWSFKANCMKHEPIHSFVKSQLKSATFSKSKTQYLNECVDDKIQNTHRNSLKNHKKDGP